MHKELAKTCLLYNQFTCFQKSHYCGALNPESYPFLQYTSTSWIYHVTSSKPNDNDLLDEIARFFSSKQAWRWIERFDFYDITNGHLLLMQAELRNWVKCEPSNIRADLDMMGRFILYLSKKQCDSFRSSGENEIETLSAIFRVADLYKENAQFSEALELYEQTLAGWQKAFGEEHSDTLGAVHNIAHIYDKQGRYSEALELYERALVGRRKVHGEEHPSTLTTLKNIAIVYYNQGRYAEALERYERALAGYRKVHGEEHPSTLTTLKNMANVYHDQGRYAEALELYERALAGWRKILGEEHPRTLEALSGVEETQECLNSKVDA